MNYLSIYAGNAVMSPDEIAAELCGIILGDGHVHKHSNRITISGSSDDLVYFRIRVIPLFQKLFPFVNPRIVKLKNKNAYNLEVENKSIINFFIGRFGFKRGPKYEAHIPPDILSSPSFIPHFLRGLFDTDGCLKFSKQARAYSYYPRVRIALVSSPLTHQLSSILTQAGFTFSKGTQQNHGYATKRSLVCYEISGKHAFEKWMGLIRPANPVHVTKYEYWKKFGHYIPKITFAERIRQIGPGGFEPPSQESESRILDRYTTGLLDMER